MPSWLSTRPDRSCLSRTNKFGGLVANTDDRPRPSFFDFIDFFVFGERPRMAANVKWCPEED